MLETSGERIELLKAGIPGKTIEKLYLICNNFKIECSPLLFEPDETDDQEKKSNYTIREESAQCEEVSV
ncbi:MAG TPA: hypothetical protein VJJ51_12455 [Candidatus Methanoperedens sp.]|nr:hypothetical protein [Candidatus Methanoperedens sp.]HLB71846.1 hypothetical protein [Candidatus Methanoperedens sp.]